LGTQDNYKKFGKHLKDFFGGDKKIASITKFGTYPFESNLTPFAHSGLKRGIYRPFSDDDLPSVGGNPMN
jgi:hypothetical protein